MSDFVQPSEQDEGMLKKVITELKVTNALLMSILSVMYIKSGLDKNETKEMVQIALKAAEGDRNVY